MEEKGQYAMEETQLPKLPWTVAVLDSDTFWKLEHYQWRADPLVYQRKTGLGRSLRT